jgi:hypothetical protein
MASIRRELELSVPADGVWDALADFGAVHRRVAPGFLKDAKLEGESRVVSFASGVVFREHLVDLDHERRRLVYASAEPPFLTYQGTVEIEPAGVDSCRLSWTVDMLSNEVSGQVAQQMDIALKAMKPALEGGANGNDQ